MPSARSVWCDAQGKAALLHVNRPSVPDPNFARSTRNSPA